MPSRSLRRSFAIFAVLAVVVTACSTSSDKSSDKKSSTTGTGGANTASARGVTADTIKIGLSYPDLEALAKTGVIKVDNGPYGDMGKVLVDDINANGGVNGRKLQLFTEKYSVLENSAQLAACTKLTEDDAVFAVIGGFIGDTNLCISQQHSTVLISGYGSGYNQIATVKARAPWATWNASDERAVQALVKILDQQGSLKGKKIGLYGTLTASKPLLDLTQKTLQDSGYTVTDSAINDVQASDTQAYNAQDKVIGSRFKDKGIDTVFVLVTVPPGTNWDAIDYHPTMYSPQTALISPGAFTNPYGKFPLVAGLQATADASAGFNTPAMQHCRDVWTKATGKVILPFAQEQAQGKSTGWAAMTTNCAGFQTFVEAAKRAGSNLTNDTWLKALESIGPIALPTAPISSYGPNKPDAQDSFQLAKFNPAWTSGSKEPQFIPVGQQITFTG